MKSLKSKLHIHSFISKYITDVRILNYLFGEDLFTLELRSNYKNSHFFSHMLSIFQIAFVLLTNCIVLQLETSFKKN